jgi:hypothetical protein
MEPEDFELPDNTEISKEDLAKFKEEIRLVHLMLDALHVHFGFVWRQDANDGTRTYSIEVLPTRDTKVPIKSEWFKTPKEAFDSIYPPTAA